MGNKKGKKRKLKYPDVEVIPHRTKKRFSARKSKKTANSLASRRVTGVLSDDNQSDTATSHLISYDKNLFGRVRTQWQFGDWAALAALDRASLQNHPKREKLALMAAAGHLQQGGNSAAKELISMARQWGCSRKSISRILVSGVYNTLGRAAAAGGQEARALGHFQHSISTGDPGGDAMLLTRARAGEQMVQLGIVKEPLSQGRLPTFDIAGNKLITGVQAQEVQAGNYSALVKTVKEEISSELKAAQTNPYGHNRTMTATLNKSLRDYFASAFHKNDLKPAYIDYLAMKAMEIEKLCIGRLATTVQDGVVRMLVAESVAGPHLGVLEIGALFGVNLAIIFNHCITRFDSVKVICLDPFDGYYGKPIDAAFNLPINPESFCRNMQLGNVPVENYRLIQKYSTDLTALEAVRKERITLLIIDGDHSYDGVKFDYENYFPVLEPGGYVIFDDYNAKEWPGVQNFIDQVVRNDPVCEWIGAFSRTAIGRKTH